MYQGEKGLIRSQQGRGSANIRTPVDTSGVDRLADRLERRSVREGKTKADAQTKRDKRLNDAFDLGKLPDITERDFESLSEEGKKLNQMVIDADKSGELHDISSAKSIEIRKAKQDYIDKANLAKMQYTDYAASAKRIKDAAPSEFFNKREKLEELDRSYFGDNGERTVYSDSKDYEKFDLYKGMDIPSYAAKYASSVKEKSQSAEAIEMQGGQEYLNKRETRGRFIKMENGEVLRDPETGKIIPFVTDEEATSLLRNERFRGGIQEMLQDESGVNEFEDEMSLTKKILGEHAQVYGEEQDLTRIPKDRGGARDPSNKEDYFFNHVGGLLSGDLSSLKTGDDVIVDVPKEGKISLRKIENSPLDKGSIGRDAYGDNIISDGVFINPDKPGTIYIRHKEEGEYVTQVFGVNDIPAMVSFMSLRGDYNREKMDAILRSREAIDQQGKFDPSRFYTPKPGEQEKVRAGEQIYQESAAKSKQVITTVLDEIDNRGAWSSIKNWFGNETEANSEFSDRLNKELEKSSIFIDDVRYDSPQITIDKYGNFTAKDKEGEIIKDKMNDGDLQKFLKDNDILRTRDYLESTKGQTTPKKPSSGDGEVDYGELKF